MKNVRGFWKFIGNRFFFADFIKKIGGFLKFTGVTWGHTKNLGQIGSAVLTLIGYKQADRPNLFIVQAFGQVFFSNKHSRRSHKLEKQREIGYRDFLIHSNYRSMLYML